jgi:predicted nucleotide-binding protein
MAKLTDKQATDELNRQLDEIDKVRKKPRMSPAFKTWQIETGELLENVFGRRSRQIKDFDNISYSLAAFSNQTPESKFDEAFHQGLKSAAIVLASAIKDVKKRGGAKSQVAATAEPAVKEKEPQKPAAAPAPVAPSPAAKTSPPPQRSQPSAVNNKVFVVYADGNSIKNELTDFLAKIGLSVVLVQGKPGRQNDVIDKLEKHPDVSYAIVLLNPAATGISHDVVFELGMLVGGLGRDRVCGLVTEKLDILANYSGLSYVPHDPAGAWKFMMIKQLKTAGFEVDANLAL